MPRNMSFKLTTPQILNKSKTVTRRLGWHNLKPGTLIWACLQCQGLKKGQKVRKLALIRITNVTKEPLNSIPARDCPLEGFPHMTPQQFVAFFCLHNRCSPTKLVNRIEFEYVDQPHQLELVL